MRFPRVTIVLLFVGAIEPLAPARSDGSVALDFNRDVRPILSQHCFACHGPDAAARKAGLRLDRFESATEPHGYGTIAIVPGDPSRSELMRRIRAHESADTMPPPEFKKPLTTQHITTLERWIEEGARYASHWAFSKLPAEVLAPTVRDESWPENAIDRFVLARLESEGLAPSPDADRSTLLRRVSLDLTGLPPTPEEVRAFLDDAGVDAYETQVDRLLASPHYGERLAQVWLDLSRYADSYGYQSDQLSSLWPWRDFVVDSFNDNLPYDQFVTWQIAGDLLPNPTREQRLATAFNRLHRMTNEGGTIHEEFRIEGVADRVNTFGATFLGLTTECARCHDHKFDPLSTREYYSLFSAFQNIEEEGTYLASHLTPTPSLLLPNEAQDAALAAASAAVLAARESLARTWSDQTNAMNSWIERGGSPASIPDRKLDVDFERIENGVAIGAIGKIDLHGTTVVGGLSGKALRLDGETAPNFDPGLLDGAVGDLHVPFSIAFTLNLPTSYAAESRVIVQRSGGTDVGYHGFDVLLVDGRPIARLFRSWPGNALAIRGAEELPKGRRFHLACTYDGYGTAAGLALYVDGRKVKTTIEHDRAWKSTDPGGAFSNGFAFGARFRDRGLEGALLDDVTAFRRALAPIEVAQLVDGESLVKALVTPGAHAEELREYYGAAVSEPIRAASAALHARIAERVAVENGIFELPVMDEAAPRPAFVLARGAYDAPDPTQPVVPQAPAALGLEEVFEPRNRLGLARWLTHPDHPLLARVLVNRMFALCFGRGLVPTLENFGLQGEMPSHPELLDWLARDFVASGYDVKRTLRLLVTSRVYRQASTRSDSSRHDPENVLLARGPSKRQTAEMLRDSALFAAGLLVLDRGGPPVSPYQPANYWTESNSMSPGYHQSVGADLWRRSLYTVWKRTAPMPNLSIFDAPNREACTPRRLPTNTPLQALVLLNDVQFVEAARVLASRVAKLAPDDAGRIATAFSFLACRLPDPNETRILARLLESERARFGAAPDRAKEWISTGEAPADTTLDPIEHAALSSVVQTILNLDVFITVR